MYTLIDAGSIVGNLGANRIGVIAGRNAMIDIAGNNLVLYTPEPSAIQLIAFSSSYLAVRRRRTRCKHRA
jgi:hypothetical protein